ncbi:MAG TPA: GNAT family N-acetyltransferase [Bryobacteraceae bacterium]|nr:GNAT family N-acetyltransferase [Bryobacteraceae bacterium]
MSVRVLTPADVPAAMRIKQAAGWNQTETDWLNLIRLAPDTCFGLDCDGALAATTTAVTYERKLAWIGMVLTHPDHRRRGFARLLMEHALEALVALQIEWIKLDATEMGAPLYRDLGFEDEGPVERWRAVARGGPAAEPAGWTAECAELDRTAFGADRSRLLAALAPLGAAAVTGAGYAMARPGSEGAYFGPCVSRTPEAVRELLGWFLSRHAGLSVYWDLLPGNAGAVRLARACGFQPVRRLVRMARPAAPGAAPLQHDDSQVFAIAGFEYG